MSMITIMAESASFNVPREIIKKKLDFTGIPASTFSGMLYVLLGQRPPSRFSGLPFLRVSWIDELVKNTQYRFVSKIKTSKPVPKIEDYFGRLEQYTSIKNVNITSSMVERGAGTEFLDALTSVFGECEVWTLFTKFEQMACDALQKEESETKLKALAQLEQLRNMEKETKAVRNDTNWRLSAGYLLKPFMNKWWVNVPTPFAGNHIPGIPGRPLRKFVFNAEFFVSVPKKYQQKVNDLLLSGPRCASLGAGGLAWVVAPDHQSPIYVGNTPGSCQELNFEDTPLFIPSQEVVK